jgi:hypothetical protein
MGTNIATPPIVTNGLVLALDAANPKSFPDGEPTSNSFPSPINLSSNRSNAAQIGAIFTDFSTGSFNNGPFVRLTRNVNSTPSPTTAWDFEYSTTNPGYPDGTKHAFSFYARSVDGSTPTIKMSIPDSQPQTFNLTTEWQRFIGLFTLGAQFSGYLWVRINRSNQQFVSGSSFDISNAQIEFKDYATPFVNGSRTLWKDLSGNNNNGTLVSNPTYNLTNNGNIVTSGSAYISTSLYLPSPSTTPTTFEIVFKNNGINSSNYGLIGSSQYTQYGFAVALPASSLSTMRCTYNNSGSSSEFDVSYDSSVVSMCTYIFNGTTRSVYRNGVFLQSNTAGFNALASPNPISIGNIGQGGYPIGQLNIYSTKIYNRALSEAEIQQNYKAQKSRFNLQ